MYNTNKNVGIELARKNTIDYNNLCKFENGTGPWGKNSDGKIIGLKVPLASTICYWGDELDRSDFDDSN